LIGYAYDFRHDLIEHGHAHRFGKLVVKAITEKVFFEGIFCIKIY
jgi:hypothetical protein